MSIVYLNGNFMPQASATISVMDRGFLFADSIYEVIPLFAGKLLGIDAHLIRFEQSLAAIYMEPPLTAEQWRGVIDELLVANKVDQDHNIYLQVTRGAGDHRDHSIPSDLEPTVFACLTPAKSITKAIASKGFSAITLEDSRRRDCYIKATSLLPNVLLYEQARRQGAFEAILVRNSLVSEGTSSNVFIVKDEVLITPPLNEYILGGVTRDLVLAIAREHHIAYREAEILETELYTADEIWVTGSSKEICPIVTLNQSPVGTGLVGPIWHRVRDHYEQYKLSASIPSTYRPSLQAGEDLAR